MGSNFYLDYLGVYAISSLNHNFILNFSNILVAWGKSLLKNLLNNIQFLKRLTSPKKPQLDYLDEQDLSRFSEQDMILESENQIQKYLPEVLGQALARTWIDKRFLDAFYNYPIEVLERGGVYLPDSVSVEFKKEKDERPRVIVYEKGRNFKKKLLELKLIMVAEQ